MGEEGKTVEQQSTDDFSEAFERIAANLKEPGSSVPEAAAAAEAQNTPEAKAAAEKAAADKAAADAAASEKAAADKAAAEKAAADKAAADAEAAAAAARTPEENERIAAEKAAAEKAAAESKAAAEKAAAEKAAADADVAKQLAEANARIAELTKPPEKKAEEKPIYTDDEKAHIEKSRKDWEDVHRAEELIRRAEYVHLTNHIFGEIQKVYGPLLEYIEARTPRDQYQDIKGLVPDYDQVRDQAVKWALEQPSLVKTAYERVIKEGSPEEVRDLITIWRQSTGYKAPAAPAADGKTAAGGMAAAPGTPAAQPPVDPKAAAAAASLRVVDSKRSEQTAGPDTTDFAGAFAEFAKTGT